MRWKLQIKNYLYHIIIQKYWLSVMRMLLNLTFLLELMANLVGFAEQPLES